MRVLLIALTASVIALGFAGTGEADTVLFSPILQAPAGGGFHCSALNISNTAKTISVTLCDVSGLAMLAPAGKRER